jgi:two-component system CheB/CheR fusion protein
VLFVAVDATGQHAGEVRQQGLLEEVRRAAGITTTANEALETLNEELQSTSEEQQTLNEELESRNEELQTVNEELQSMNEELNTLNEEVGARIADADRLGRYLRTVLESNPQAVIGCDARHTITFWNAAARKLFRVSEAEALGHDLLKMVPAFDVPRVRTFMNGRPGTAPVWIDAGKRVGRIRIGMTLIRDARGQRAGYVLRVQEGRAVEERPRRHRRPQR